MAGRNQVVIGVGMNLTDLKNSLREMGYDIQQSAKKSEDAFAKSTSKIGKSFSSLGSMAGEFGLPIQGALDAIGAKFDAASGKGDGLKGKLEAIGGTVAAAGAAGLLAVGGASLKMADAYEGTQASLEAAVRASGGSMKKLQDPIDAAKQKMQSLGFTADDTNNAIAAGVISTQNTGTAIKNLGLAADLARYKHISLSDAASLVDKAMTGNMKPLKALGIDLPITATNALKLQGAQSKLKDATDKVNFMLYVNHGHIKAGSKAYPGYIKAVQAMKGAQDNAKNATEAHTKIHDALVKRLGGQSSAYVNTFHGRMEVLKASMHNTGVEIGQKLMPIIAGLMKGISKVMDYLDHHKAVMIALGIVIGGILITMAAMWVINTIAAMSFWVAATGGIIILVAALAVGIAWLVSNWGMVWGYMKAIAVGFWQFLDNNVIHPIADAFVWLYQHSIGPAVQGISDAWNGMTSALKAGWDWVSQNVLNPIVSFFQGLGSGIASALGGVADIISAPFTMAFNAVKSLWNSTIGGFGFTVPSWVPFAGGDSFKIPMMATGGYISGGPVIVGEKGPELLNLGATPGRITPNSQLRGLGGASQNITINAVTNASAHDLANELGWVLRRAS